MEKAPRAACIHEHMQIKKKWNRKMSSIPNLGGQLDGREAVRTATNAKHFKM